MKKKRWTPSDAELSVIYRALVNSIGWEDSLADANKSSFSGGYCEGFDVQDWRSHVAACKRMMKKIREKE
jgi:hypothetical protein